MSINETTVSEKASINYEEAMDLLLKSMEKSEVFQLRKHISKLGILICAILLCMDFILIGYVIGTYTSTKTIQSKIDTVQQILIQEPQEPVVEPIPEENNETGLSQQEFEREVEESYKKGYIEGQEYASSLLALTQEQECTEEWFNEYKGLTGQCPEIFDAPESIQDVISADELMLFCRCVETECHGAPFECKVNVANVILNRLNTPNKWGDTVTEVITSPGQFAYGKTSVENSTIAAVEYAFQFEDTTQGAIRFNSNAPNTSSPEYLFTDECGHSFYKDKEQTIYEPIEVEDDEDDDAVG